MPYLIDGHNLIPKLGLTLDDPQDEIKLVERMQVFCQLRKTQVEIYFDGGVAGQPKLHNYGSVKAHFVRDQNKTNAADAAIESRLMKLGRTARNWSVVSSDHRVQSAAREVHARVFSSDEFARMVTEAHISRSVQNKTDAALSPEDVSEWMDIFNTPKQE
jgi:predicted RNA-binding protein with PIN domain